LPSTNATHPTAFVLTGEAQSSRTPAASPPGCKRP
jgi:hypothetical protein